jgi:biopolymer transport protein ExbB
MVLLVSSLWFLDCTSRRETTDAEPAVLDADSPPDVANLAPNLDGRLGLYGGSSCDGSAQCLSGACTLGVCSDWAFIMQIFIDTSSSGADVREDVTDFPLLVRLNAQNFPFGEARRDGADIRFVDTLGNNLNYEIERWDDKNAVAEVWVLVPRIAGNSRSNVILMFWGNTLATPTSSGTSVFADNSLVFHMSEDPSTTQIQDDSGQGNTGFVQNQAQPGMNGDGIAGNGLTLDGTNSFLSTSLRLTAPQPVAISLWLKTHGSTSGGVAGFANKQSGNNVDYDRAIEMDSQGRLSFSILHDGVLSTVSSLESYSDDQWHFIVAQLSSSGQYLFVDGEAVADDPATTNADTYLGFWRFGEAPATEDSAGDFFSGSLDEARITLAPLSDAWIKLAYATQRPDATAVRYAQP